MEILEAAIRTVVASAEVLAPDGRRIRWGTQLEVHPITAQGPGEQVSGEVVKGYLAKDACGRVAEYSTKGAEWAGALDRPIWCRKCEGTGRIDASSERTTLDVEPGEIGSARHGDGTGMSVKIENLKVSDHVRRMIRTCWELGGDPRYVNLKLWRWAHQLGYGGHFLSKGRRYSTTFAALRQVRRDFCTAHTLARVGLDRATPVVRLSADGSVEASDVPAEAVEGELVVVIGAWRYHSRGHSPGERLWARSVADGNAENRRLAREARWDQQPDYEDWEAA